MAFSPLTAVNIIMTYGVTTLQKLGTSVDAFTSSIVLGVALIFGSLTSTYLADTLGRRKLNLISLFGAAAGLSGTALYHYLNLNGYNLTSFAWIPIVCLCFVLYISTAGIMTLAAVCSVENLPPKVCAFILTVFWFDFMSENEYFHQIFAGSHCWNGCEWCLWRNNSFYIVEVISNSLEITGPARMPHDLCIFLLHRFYFRIFRIGRNDWPIT